MFCPRCGTENKPEQHYCRQCGLALPAVRLALEGHVDEAIQKCKKSEVTITWGAIIIAVGLVNAGINVLLHAWQPAIFSGALGFIIGMIVIITGLERLGRANKLLNPSEKDKAKSPALAQPEHAADAALPPAPITEELKRTHARQPSVVENTTMKLKQPK